MPSYNYSDSLYFCIQERTDPDGMFHTVTMVLPGVTAEDAANHMLAHTHLQDDWKVRSVKAVPFGQVLSWEVEESPAWKLVIDNGVP